MKKKLVSLMLSVIAVCCTMNTDAKITDNATKNINITAGISKEMGDIMAQAIAPTPSPIVTPTPTLQPKKYWAKKNVNIRTTPIDGEIIKTLKQGNTIKVLDIKDGWAIVEYNYKTAYICVEYLSDEYVPKPLYDDVELHELSHVIYGEAGNQSKTCMLYVGSVVLNRVKHKDFPNTIYNVIHQSGQYACTWDGNFDRNPSDKAIEAAKWLLINGSVLPDNVVYQAEFKQGSGVHCTIGNTVFCYY